MRIYGEQKMRLAILDDYEGVALEMADWNKLVPKVQIDVYRDNIKEKVKLLERLLPYDILVIMRERTSFPRDLLERLPNLKLLITTGKLNLAIDLATCKERGIVVCGTAPSNTAAAELAWALILATLRRIPQHDRAVRDGFWTNSIGSNISNKVLGILGLGRLGTQVCRVGLAFGMNVIAWSPNLTPYRAAEVGAVFTDKKTFFSTADIISIHLILSNKTRNLIGKSEINLMKPESYLINTSRGPIIEEAALLEALKKKRIAGAGLDVFDHEPLLPNHPFLKLDNTVITPHIGYVTKESFQVFFREALEDVSAWLSGKPLRVIQP